MALCKRKDPAGAAAEQAVNQWRACSAAAPHCRMAWWASELSKGHIGIELALDESHDCVTLATYFAGEGRRNRAHVCPF